MNDSAALRSLQSGIHAHLVEWDRPHVEIAIHGRGDAAFIASALDEFCVRELGSPITELLFYQSSVGAVAGVVLGDGRKVVVKAHQPDSSLERLKQAIGLQRLIARETGLAPIVIAEPAMLGKGFATVEAFDDRGEWRSGHDTEPRRALASSLHDVIQRLSSKTADVNLPAPLLCSPPSDALWPTPHSRLFDFEATTQGAEYIDKLAELARLKMRPAGRLVIGHCDWRTEHLRYQGERVVLAYDWDSLCKEFEPAIIGATAHMFCGDWSRDDYVQAPSFDEAREFVADYESAAGRAFSNEERQLCGAAFAYSVAYTSRCGHAGGADTRDVPGTYQYLIAQHGPRLLDL